MTSRSHTRSSKGMPFAGDAGMEDIIELFY